MSIGVGQHTKVAGNTTATTPAITTVSGSTLVVGVLWSSAPSFVSIEDSKSNTWTQVGSEQTTGGFKARFYRVENCIGGAGHTVTVVVGSDVLTVFFLEITGAAVASYDSGSMAQATDAASPFTVTSGTLAQAAELVVVTIGSDSFSNPATLAESSGFTIQEKEENGSNWTGGIATKIVSATTPLTPSFTQTGATNAALTIAGFKEPSPPPFYDVFLWPRPD